jgi:manganese transport protein
MAATTEAARPGWRSTSAPSLPEVNGSIIIPKGLGVVGRHLRWVGPGFMVAVGYMDPGNWATDLAGGAQFKYMLLSVILISNLMAIFLQALTARLGIVTGRDLAQACRDTYPRPVSLALWILCEIAIVACDLAEVIGSAIALKLLFGLPLVVGVVLTAADVLIILFLQGKGFRFVEALVMALIATIGVCFAIELVMARPDIGPLLAGYIPTPEVVFNPAALYIAIGILGATVMPHNLYLHSSIVQTRAVRRDAIDEQRSAVKHATIDSTAALMMALFINSAILILSAAVFNATGNTAVDSIEDAHALLTPLLGTGLASVLFALALLASGQNSTLTGTLAGQIVMEGFLALRIRPWVRRIITRLLAIVPAVIAVWLYGEQGTVQLLILSQVVLSMQLSFAVFPLLQFTSDRRKMGEFVNAPWARGLGYGIGTVIAGLNIYLLYQTFAGGLLA